jgi:hypothetical protein
MNEWGVLLTLVGVWGWIGSLLMFMFKAFPARGEFRTRQGLSWGSVAVLFFGLWIVGMLVA